MHYPPLTAQALRYLQQLQQRLNASGSERVTTNVKAVQQVLAWCIEHELVPGNSLQLPHFTFTQALLKNIASVQQRLQQACFLDNLSQNSRLNNANASQQELKSIGLQPRQNRVLVKLNMAVATNLGIAADIIDIDWQHLPLAQFDALLIVENLDCFYQLASFNVALPYQQPLVIYRGDEVYSKGCKALSAAWHSSAKPSIYFGDADLAGLSIALSLQCQNMLLPAISEFTQRASPAMLDDKQLKYQQRLQQMSVSAAFLPYQQLLCQQLIGLRQQNMQEISLIPVNLLG
ncbi:DUF7281 domain-containing protein [Arsukibacterium indicum]|uniref:DUF7281 domain-containing protein n=1 Tax=Arsukibacterium indicum TaxID=2848612 RepID=A0ABS6MK96_9GAMM|nr:Wadjet anti-phage system protein JetD domain-containing protein [Arsukibacterium indicum]MBV2129246.1 hypothetical protein [Arsukibacterium indicum]